MQNAKRQNFWKRIFRAKFGAFEETLKKTRMGRSINVAVGRRKFCKKKTHFYQIWKAENIPMVSGSLVAAIQMILHCISFLNSGFIHTENEILILFYVFSIILKLSEFK